MENEARSTALKSEKPVGSRSLKIIAISSFFLAFAGVVAISIGWREYLLMRQQLVYTQQQIQQQQKQNSVLKDDIKNLQDSVKKLQQSFASAPLLIQLADITLLLQEADLHLHYRFNPDMAITLLKKVEQRVAVLSLSGVEPFKEKLINTITALQVSPRPDRPAILLKLTSLQQQINALPDYHVPKAIKQPVSQAGAAASGIAGWREHLHATGMALQKIIVIRHNIAPVMPLLPPAQYAYIKQNIQQQLAQAQWAVIEQHEVVYQSCLQQTIYWLQQFYATNPTTPALVTLLQNLKAISLKPAGVPDISPLLTIIAELQREIK